MMKFSLKKIFILLLVVSFGLTNAQSNGPGVPCFDCDKKPTTPIDMYVYVLAIAAFLIIAFVAKKYKTQKI